MAKDMISVTVGAGKVDLVKGKCDLLAVGVFSGGGRNALCDQLDKKLKGAIGRLRKLGDFKGEDKSAAVVYGDDKIGARRVLLVGLGERKKVSLDTLRDAAAVATGQAVELRARKAVLALHQEALGKKLTSQTVGQALAEGAHFGSYRYDEYMAKSKDGRLNSLKVVIGDAAGDIARQLAKGARIGDAIGTSQSFARTIANRPGNVINPPTLAAATKKMVREAKGLSCVVLDEKQLKAKKMGGILAVGKGSASKPRLIVMKYTPPGRVGSKVPVIGLVGKGVTFDSGGISLKPGSGMQDMKFDMSGGAAVIGAMRAIAAIKPAIRVIGIVPSAENLPSSISYRPGDIITTFSGKTVEVQNTDAEGRLLLCDGLHYAVKQKCDIVIDIATLTGACMVALGKYKGGLMGNNDRLIKAFQAASKASGEKIWHMPSGDEYLGEMKSKIADLKNIGSRWGGACTAAAFLSQFVGDVKWAHVDMAGVDMFDGGRKVGSVGSTGFGVRLLTSYVLGAAKG